MKKILVLLIGFLVISSVAFSKTSAPAAKSSDFTKHSIGFHVTPSADYLFYRQGKSVFFSVDEPYEHRYPFIGFSFGAEYIYRPVEVFGVSTGLQVDMQGGFWRDYFPGTRTVIGRTNYHDLYISLPIYFHIYKQMQNCTFEFATGPEFNFPLLERWATTSYSLSGNKMDSEHGKEKLTAKETKDYANLGWSIFLGGVKNLCDYADLFIGPQIQFQNLAFFKKDFNETAKTQGRYFPVSLGLKLGFRFHK